MSTLLDPVSTSILERLHEEQERVRLERDRSGQRIADAARQLLAPPPAATSKADIALSLLQNGMSIAKGVQTGVSVVAAVRTMLGLKRRLKK